jgi:hypothetical protein
MQSDSGLVRRFAREGSQASRGRRRGTELGIRGANTRRGERHALCVELLARQAKLQGGHSAAKDLKTTALLISLVVQKEQQKVNA